MEERRIPNEGGYAKMLRCNNLKQKDVAKFTGLTRNTISNYAKDTRGIKLGHLQDIAKHLKVSPQKIVAQILHFDREEQREKEQENKKKNR